jgi:hypothetical protein
MSTVQRLCQSYIVINCGDAYQILKKKFESLEAPKNDNSVIEASSYSGSAEQDLQEVAPTCAQSLDFRDTEQSLRHRQGLA